MSRLHSGGLKAVTGGVPLAGSHRNGKVMMPTKYFLVVAVEKEVRASCVVAILKEFGERKAKKPLIKVDGLFNI